MARGGKGDKLQRESRKCPCAIMPSVVLKALQRICACQRHTAAPKKRLANMHLECIFASLRDWHNPKIYFCRTAIGTEVDIVIESAGRLIPIEVKLSSAPRPQMAASIRAFREDFGSKAGPGYVVHTGDGRLSLGEGITAVPFAELLLAYGKDFKLSCGPGRN